MSKGRSLERSGVATARAPQTKEEQRKASIEKLLGAALALFVTRGYQATSVEEVAARAELTKGAVYFYFRSKAQLLLTLLERVEAQVVAPTLAAIDAGQDPRDRLVGFMHSQSLVGAERTELMLLAILMATEFQGSADPIEQRLDMLFAKMYAALTDVIEQGKSAQVFRRDLGTAETVAFIMAMNQGCFVEWYRRRNELDGPAFVRAMRGIVLDGVIAR